MLKSIKEKLKTFNKNGKNTCYQNKKYKNVMKYMVSKKSHKKVNYEVS